jgi:hypothetical protein
MIKVLLGHTGIVQKKTIKNIQTKKSRAGKNPLAHQEVLRIRIENMRMRIQEKISMRMRIRMRIHALKNYGEPSKSVRNL